MPDLITGISYEQKVQTVANNDTDINTAITTQGADNWVVSQLIISGTDVIILFSRQTEELPA